MWSRIAAPALAIVVGCAAAGCSTAPPKGTQIGAIREPDPDPAPPSDLRDLDLRAAVEEALRLAGKVTAASAFDAHTAALARAEAACPAFWTGPLPEGVSDVALETDGLAWLDDCATSAGDTWSGFTLWQGDPAASEDGSASSATRELAADAVVTDASGEVLWSFDGEVADELRLDAGIYASRFAGTLTGALAGVGSGIRAQNNTESADGGFAASWSADGLVLQGALEVFDGFGPADRRPADAPELQSIVGWASGEPRFTSVRFDLTFSPDCAEEPLGYVGLRGNEGFWFDVYFLPIHDPSVPSAESNAFPFEQIENVACDGVGTVFSRNVDLSALDAADDAWSSEIAPDFAGMRRELPMPTVDAYLATLRQLPRDDR